MVRREVVRCLPLRGGLCAFVLLALVVTLLGCSHEQQTLRLQSGEESERDHYDVKTIGEVFNVGNAEPMQIGGVGLVTGLDGNGGDCPPDTYRALLEADLHKQKVVKVKEVLADPNNAMVFISGEIPPGARIGDPIDLEVRLPARTQAVSLRGGTLQPCYLFNFATTRQVIPGTTKADTMLRGQTCAKAEGPVLVGFTGGDESAQVKQGRIWAGARCKVENNFTLLLKEDLQFKARMTERVCNRINERFQGVAGGGDPATALAMPRSPTLVELRVPPQYRLNMTRFLLVTRLIPLQQMKDLPSAGLTYRTHLGEDLLDPARTVSAALRLEALGEESLPQLRVGMRSENELVRFCSAEAMAYLGQAGAAEDLGRLVVSRPLFRAYALTALASLDENASRRELENLLASDHDDETRYGAFRALRALEENHPAVAGEMLNNAFWFHRVAPLTPSLVHLSSTQRAEIVLFGGDVILKPPFSLLAGEYSVRAQEEDDHCTVTYVPLKTDNRSGDSRSGVATRRTCELKLEDILRAMTDLGAQYPEAIDLIMQAESIHCLNCRVARDALPQGFTEAELSALGQLRPGEAVPDLGGTPTLFETGRSKPAPRPPAEPIAGPPAQQRILGLE
jgi:flagellar basal body P-ring protein FlgI